MLGATYNGVRLALEAIGRSPLRSALTILGMLIGVAAVVTMTALGSGARRSVSEKIEAIGSNVIFVFPQSSGVSGARAALGTGPRLSEEDGHAIVRESVSVAAAAPALRARAQVVHADKNMATQVIGTTRPFLEIRNWPLAEGSLWEESDETVKTKVCIIGSTVKRELFGEADAIGGIIRIGQHNYRVTGVLASKGESPFGGDQDAILLMPIGTMRSRIKKTTPGFAGILLISAKSAEVTDRAARQIDEILRQRHRITEGAPPDYSVRTQKEFQKMQETVYGVMTVLLVCIAAVSLFVGGIGVMNIMLVSVTERTREIGIRMAIGARAADVRLQFLVEAVVLALIGGLSGAVAGLGTIELLETLLEWPMKLDPTALALAVMTSALTGIVFGFFPARRAAQLDPIVALRHE
jgi:putative ABC transport system permease protein